MKLETILRACLKRTTHAVAGIDDPIKVRRQQGTFRSRILRMDAEKDKQIMSLIGKNARMTARIAELEAEVRGLTEKNWDNFDSLMANDRHT